MGKLTLKKVKNLKERKVSAQVKLRPSFSYRWTLKDSKFEKVRGKAFSCFSCGGGSTMGYKLAGFDVIGFNEIDERMARLYIRNHSPQFQFVEPIQKLVDRPNLPTELFDLDILDGSPPCSSFSMAGNREKDWGRLKVFKEGQAKQVLDTLFFDFIRLAERLKPKLVIAENVNGILFGNAIEYAKRIINEFDTAGYAVKEFMLKAVDMGVPQRRERVFFIAVRKDLIPYLPTEPDILFSDFPALDLKFNYDEIPFKEVRNDELNDAQWTDHDDYVWRYRRKGDRNYSQVLQRIEGRDSNFNASFVYGHKAVSTISSTEGSKMVLFDAPRRMNSEEMKLAQSFPTDYNFMTDRPSEVQYVLGMSVPPVMTAHIVSRIYEQWSAIFNASS